MNLNQVLEDIGFGRFHYWIYFLGGTVIYRKAWVQDMISIISSAVIVNNLGEEWSLSDTVKGIMGGVFMLGMFFGSYICGALADRKGRMFPFKRTMILVLFSLVFLLVSVNAYMTSIGLFCYGFTAGGEITIGGVVFQEFCPPSKLYMLVSLSLAWCFGAMITALAVSFFMAVGVPFGVWRWLCVFNIVIALLVFIIRLKAFETPRFLIANEREEEAHQVLKLMCESNKKNYVSSNYIELHNEGHSKEISRVQERKSDRFAELWNRKNLRNTVLFSLSYFFANLSFNFLNFFMPELLSDVGIEGIYVFLTMAAQQATGIPGILLAVYLVETRCGRKYSIAFSMICCGVVNLVFIFSRKYWELVVFSSISTSLNYLSGSVIFTITPESYDTNIRNTAVGWANACGKIGGLVGPLIGGIILGIEGGFYMCIVFTSAFNVLVGILGLMLKETRGTSLY